MCSHHGKRFRAVIRRSAIQGIDLLSGPITLDALFDVVLSGEMSNRMAILDQRPVLYLSEGRKVTFKDGREITREQYSMTPEGSAQISGYAKFSDGVDLSLCVNRVSDYLYSVDLDFRVSNFDGKDTKQIPDLKKSELSAPGLQLEDGGVYYVGSLRRGQKNTAFGLISWGVDNSTDILTIWLRVREVARRAD